MNNKYMKVITMAGLIAVFSGCGIGNEDTEDTSDVKIVEGTTTSLRPEIGQFRGCTATLFHRHYVIAAAHCLNYPNYTDTAVRPTDSFSGTGISGASFSYGVNNIYSFARARYEYTMSDTMTNDAIVIRLAADVPATVAVPANLSDILPATGWNNTIFGYGCTDRTTSLGGGGKQYISFLYGNKTQALCPGDSGGPAVHGAVNGNGAVWGVNSDYSGSGAFATWNDIFADIPGLKGQILALMMKWDGARLGGIDFFGHDYRYIDMTPGQEVSCQVQCTNDVSCKAYTFVNYGSEARCFLKDRVPGFSQCPNCTSGLATPVESGIDRRGSDYRSFNVGNLRIDQCLSECARDGNCKAYTFVAPTACWLKNAIPVANNAIGMASGSKRSMEYGSDRPGGDYANRAATTANQCRTMCANEGRCRSFTFVAATNRCWLKATVPNPVAQASMYSGVKRGFEIDTDRPGGDYRSFELEGSRPEECQATCARESQCLAFTYVPRNGAAKARCWLKSSVPAVAGNLNMISGIKGTEFF